MKMFEGFEDRDIKRIKFDLDKVNGIITFEGQTIMSVTVPQESKSFVSRVRIGPAPESKAPVKKAVADKAPAKKKGPK